MKSNKVTVAVRVTYRNGCCPLLGHIVSGVNEGLGYYATAVTSFFAFCSDLWSEGGRKYFVQTKHGPSPCFDTKDGAVARFMGCYLTEHLVPDEYQRMLGYYEV